MSNILVVERSSEINYDLSNKLADKGYDVIATNNQNKVGSEKINLTYHHLNVLDKETDVHFLPQHLDDLVYCPGSVNLKPFHRIKPEEFAGDYELQVLGEVQMRFNFHTQDSASKGAIEGSWTLLELSKASTCN